MARNIPALISIAISFSSEADKEAIAIAFLYFAKGESYSKAKGSAGISASVREIPVIVHIAVAAFVVFCFILYFLSFFLCGRVASLHPIVLSHSYI